MTASAHRRQDTRARRTITFRTMTLLVIVAGVVAAAVRALRGSAVPALEPASPPEKPWPALRPDAPSDAEPDEISPAADAMPDRPDWVGPAAAPVESYPVAAPPETLVESATPGEGAPAWVAATSEAPPDSHPIKAKLSSGIYHLPGMQNYDRTKPDRYYRSAEEAEADGLRPAKR